MRCLYCVPSGGFTKIPYANLPSLDHLVDAVEWIVREFNVRLVRLTGGEPLLRPGLVKLVARLAKLTQLDEICLATNGSRLKRLARPLKEAGFMRVNVSLDSLDPSRFERLTGGSLVETLEGIDAAIETGLVPVKLNAVLHRSFGGREFPHCLALQ
jgi:cyclic pyranopterin phosphate synthase